jgi:hypothetical protein
VVVSPRSAEAHTGIVQKVLLATMVLVLKRINGKTKIDSSTSNCERVI